MLNYKNAKTSQKALNTALIRDYYLSSCKQKNDFKFGLEYERISLDSTSGKSADYNYIEKIIKNFAHIKGWGILYDDKTVIGAMGEGSSVSLEPGKQFELSLESKRELCEIEKSTREITSLLDRIARFYNIEFAPIGLTPISTYQNIEIVKKERYEIMADYLPGFGRFAPVMMRESAGVQLNIDFESEEDAISKLKLLNYISPVLTGLFANSPIRNNKLTKYKSFRALAWKYTGKNRCCAFYEDLINNSNSNFDDYINPILDIPMLFIERDGRKIPIRGKITFREFMQNGLLDYRATLEDYILHASLCFPDVRLKNCIEIRNHDCQNLNLVMSICAFYKGLLECDYKEVFELFKDICAKEVDNLGLLAARFGLDFKYKNIDGKKYAQKLFNIANNHLKNEEKHYLEVAFELIDEGKCPADKIIDSKITTGKALLEYLRR